MNAQWQHRQFPLLIIVIIKTHRRATRYRCPSFSSSAITQSVTHGMPAKHILNTLEAEIQKPMDEHLAYKQSIIPEINSSLFCKLKLIKFVSMSTRYGGTRAVLWAKNKEEAIWGLRDQRYSANTIIGRRRKTYTLRTAFSLASASFLACLAWFSFL